MNIKIGFDEAGRGPWAGPVYASIVVLDTEGESALHQAGVTDSKQLRQKKREELYSLICEKALFYKIKYISSVDIDKVGVYKATISLIHMLKDDVLVWADLKGIAISEIKILIDGVFPGLTCATKDGIVVSHECIIKGDEKEPSISAASILAKVKRDKYMEQLQDTYPDYCFNKHKGYGTKLHHELLKKYGPCPEHRKSFKPIKSLLIK